MKRSKKKRAQRAMKRLASIVKGETEVLKTLGMTCTLVEKPYKPTKERVESIINNIRTRTANRLNLRG